MTAYRLLVALADVGSVAGAADVVGVAQPHASRTLRKLSEQHGAALTEPDGRGVRLTAAGVELVDRARPVVRSYDELAHERPAERIARISFAAHEPLSTYLLHEWQWDEAFGRLRVLDRAAGGVEHEVLDGNVDLGITAFAVPTEGLEHLEAGTWTLRAAHHPNLGDVRLRDLPWIVPVGSVAPGPVAAVTVDGWPADAPARIVAAEVSSLASAMQLAVRGIGAVWLPTCVVDAHNRAARAPSRLMVREGRGAPHVRQALHIVQRRSRPIDPRLRQHVMGAVARFAA